MKTKLNNELFVTTVYEISGVQATDIHEIFNESLENSLISLLVDATTCSKSLLINPTLLNEISIKYYSMIDMSPVISEIGGKLFIGPTSDDSIFDKTFNIKAVYTKAVVIVKKGFFESYLKDNFLSIYEAFVKKYKRFQLEEAERQINTKNAAAEREATSDMITLKRLIKKYPNYMELIDKYNENRTTVFGSNLNEYLENAARTTV